jgi:hypothetical protein
MTTRNVFSASHAQEEQHEENGLLFQGSLYRSAAGFWVAHATYRLLGLLRRVHPPLVLEHRPDSH